METDSLGFRKGPNVAYQVVLNEFDLTLGARGGGGGGPFVTHSNLVVTWKA